MQFAHLKRCTTEYGETLKPTNESEVSEIALLKARTYLSFLLDNNRLSFETDKTGDWLMYYPKGIDLGPIPKMDELPAEVVASIPTKLHMPAWQQPGMAMIKNTLSVKTLFVESFLDSSKKWLEKHPRQLQEINENVLAIQERALNAEAIWSNRP